MDLAEIHIMFVRKIKTFFEKVNEEMYIEKLFDVSISLPEPAGIVDVL